MKIYETTIIRDLRALHPSCRRHFVDLADALHRAYERGDTRSNFEPFETLRLPQRQDHLHRVQHVTNAMAWASLHQYGFAVDFVARDPYSLEWSWKDDEDWDLLHTMARDFGLHAPIKWDKPHIESPLFKEYIKQLP